MSEKKSAFPPTGPTIATLGAAPTAPPISVRWDVAALKGRVCRTCACYFEQANVTDASKVQGFCRRQPADMAEVRMEEPRRDLQKQIVYRDGQPVMNSVKVIGYLFKAARAEGTCYDGWRSLETLPGERSIDATIRKFRDRLQPALKDFPTELQPFIQALFDLGLDTGETQN